MKTWKRWDYKKEPLAYQQEIKSLADEVLQYRVMLERDYRKMLAVYNAAMKWYDAGHARQTVQSLADRANTVVSLDHAIERARKESKSVSLK